jgi:hypothetical protein
MRKAKTLRKLLGIRKLRKQYFDTLFRLEKRSRRVLRFPRKILKNVERTVGRINLSRAVVRRFAIAALAGVIVITTVFYVFNPSKVFGQTYTLTQNDWSGGISGSTVSAPDNLTGYDKYASASGVTAGDGSVAINASQGSVSDSFATTANKDSANTTAAWSGSGQLGRGGYVDAVLDAALDAAGLTGIFSSQAVDETNRRIYIGTGGTGGELAVYNTVSGIAVNLTPYLSGLGDIWGVHFLAVEGGKVYFTTLSGKFIVYNPANNSATDLSSKLSDIGNRIAVDLVHHQIYEGGSSYDSGVLWRYDPNTDQATNLTASSGLVNFWNDHWINVFPVYNPMNGKIYLYSMGAAHYYLAEYDPTSGLANDLSSSSGYASFWGTSVVRAVQANPIDGKIYMAGDDGRFGVFDPTTGLLTNLAVTSGLSALYTNAIYSLAFSPDGGTVFIGGNWNSLFAYTLSVPGSSAIITGYGGSNVRSLATSASANKLYIGQDDAEYDSITLFADPAAAVSMTLDSTPQDIFSATLTKNDTPGTGTVTYQLSNDGGSHWETVTSGSLHAFLTTGSDLRFKISIAGEATVQDVSITYDYYPAAGELVSSKLDGVDPTTVVNRLSWDESSLPSGTSVVASLRTSATADGLDAASWVNLQNGKPASEPASVAESFASTTNRDAANTTAVWTGTGEISPNQTYVATDLTSVLTSAGLGGSWSCSVIDQASRAMYMMNADGKFAKYNIVSGTVIELTTSSGISSFWGANGCDGMVMSNGKLYLTQYYPERFAVYDPLTGLASNLLSITGAGGYNIAADTDEDLIYLCQWLCIVYDPSEGEATDLTETYDLPHSLDFVVYDSNNRKIYLAATGAFFSFDGSSVSDLTVSSGFLSIFGSQGVADMIYDPVNLKVNIYNNDFEEAIFASYSPDTNTMIDVGTGLGWAGIVGYGESAASIDSSGAILLMPIAYSFDWQAYHVGSPGSLEAVPMGVPTNFMNTPNLLFDNSGSAWYAITGGNASNFRFFKLSLYISPYAAVSTSLDSASQNILSATVTKNDTPGTGTATYQLSNDGGTHWETVTPGELHVFSSTGSDLRFKILLTSNATVQDISIAYYSAMAGSGNCTKASNTVTCGDTVVPASFQDGSGDRFFQYKLTLISDGSATPTVSSIGIQFVVNAPPEIQNVSASQNADGTVTINYQVRDPDTADGSPENSGYITPSFEYWNGSAYVSATTFASGDTDRKSVNMNGITWSAYSATWGAATDYPNQYLPETVKIRVTASDGEGANPTGSAESAVFALDTKAPIGNALHVDASGASSVANLASSDDSTLYMKVSKTDPTLASTDPEPYNATKSMTLASGDTVYARFIDAYGNSSSILSATVPTTPASLIIQDTSNVTATPPAYQLFLAWKADASGNFGSYKIYRSASSSDPYPWTPLTIITSQSTNYYLNQGLSASAAWSYYVVTVDDAGNASNRSAAVSGTADGTQNGSEGGGGITGPTISNVSSGTPGTMTVTVIWDTDILSDSTVDYGLIAGSYGSSASNAALADNASGIGRHSVTITGLTPSTIYHYRVRSTDIENNTATDDHGGASYSFTTAADTTPPAISAVAVTLVNDSSAAISWTTDEPADARVGYSTDLSYSGGATAAGYVTSHLITLNGLTAETLYHFRVISADAYGNSATNDNGGNGYSFTTSAEAGRIIRSHAPATDITAPNILNLHVGSIGRNSAIVEWNTDEAADGVVKYGKTIAYGALAGSVDERVMAHQVNLSELKSGTIYHFIAVSSDAAGNQGNSVDRSFATLKEDGSVLPNAPTQPEAVTPEPEGNETPPAETQAVEASINPLLAAADAIQKAVKDYLEKNELAGNSETFNQAINELAQKMISPPVIVGVIPKVEVTGTTARITWTTDKKATSAVAYAPQGEYRPGAQDPYSGAAANLEEFSAAHAVTITNLHPATLYHFQVRSKGLVGGEAKSVDMTFRTTSDLPVISGLRVLEANDLEAMLSWTTNVPTSTEVTFKDVASGSELTQGDTALLRDHEFKLQKLQAGRAYVFSVAAADEFGNKVTSDQLPLSTTKDTTPPVISKVSSNSTLYPGKESRVQTIIGWDTDEPATSQVFYQEGLAKDAPQIEVPLDVTMVKNHTVVVTKFRPMTVYKFHVESSDAAGNLSKSNDFLVLTPQQKASVLDIIIGNFEQVFGWTKRLQR